jgi:hypothetical protein
VNHHDHAFHWVEMMAAFGLSVATATLVYWWGKR